MDQTCGMVETLGRARAMILSNHGLLTCAETVEQAVIDMIDLDRSCDLNLRAMATGRPLRLVPPEAARQARAIQSQPKFSLISSGRFCFATQLRVPSVGSSFFFS
jgi:ribulose-5-phosphate 4-epimerase/fuculose-1-phosphate aldolase